MDVPVSALIKTSHNVPHSTMDPLDCNYIDCLLTKSWEKGWLYSVLDYWYFNPAEAFTGVLSVIDIKRVHIKLHQICSKEIYVLKN